MDKKTATPECCAPCADGEHATVENGRCTCCGTEVKRFRVTERQVLLYTWYVDAVDADKAVDSALDGVPEGASVKMVESSTEAHEMKPDDDEARCQHGMFLSGTGACPMCG